ncbi:AAA family ATPase [Hydrogenobacter thermophilus]|uniref:AAA family ATPase n=1 Tax=Hydrogenobacter thermophilus TaxID=940 RepID=UPI0030FC8472
MGFFEKLFQNRKAKPEEAIRVKVGDRDLVIQRDQELETDADARIEEFWIETIGVSEDGYWLLVGRRHGILQFYDWKGKLHRLPARPPAQVVTDIVFKGNYLALLTPPYLIIYYMYDKRHPETWKSIRFSQEGIRPSAGLDIKRGTLAFGTVGERIYFIELIGDMSVETIDFSGTFSYRDAHIGQLEVIKILEDGKLLLSGSDAVAIYDRAGNLLKNMTYPAKKCVCLRGNWAIFGYQNRLTIYDLVNQNEISSTELPIKPSQMDISPDGRFLFIADAEENKLGIFDLEALSIKIIEGFGYSVVRVSPDGSIYTCAYENTAEKRFYYLIKLSSNLPDFYYTEERRRQIVKNVESAYKVLYRKLSSLGSKDGIENLKEYTDLLSLDAPIREVREILSKADGDIKRAKTNLFIRSLKEKLLNDEVQESDLRELEEHIKISEGEERQKLEALKSDLLAYFERKLKEKLEKVSYALNKQELVDLKTAESIDEVKEARGFFLNLPRDLQLQAQEQLTKMIQERLLSSRLSRYKIVIEDGRILFGSESIEKFTGEKRRLPWRLQIEEKYNIDGQMYVRVSFERADGIVREPKRYSNILKAEELKHPPKWVKSYLRHLSGLFSYQEYRLPLFVSYEETPWFVQNLEKFTALVKEQLKYQEGILILEGDAGVGKNFLVEVFSALTGRPLYIIPCNSKMEREDITFMYEFDPKRGTKKVYSDLIKALQTPGAVIYFDEINTLPASLVKMFNPLFDYRRYLVLSSGEVVKARHDVILVGGMNPQNYLGVSELPQDIKSRSDIMYVDYPPFEGEGGFYYPDEAIILKDHVEELQDISYEEFTYLWYYVINSVKTELGQKVLTPQRERKLLMIFELLSIANAIRSAYRSYQMQKSEEPVEFVFSIRDTIRCARRLDRYGNAKRAVLETILPKVSSPLEREIIKDIADRSLSKP